MLLKRSSQLASPDSARQFWRAAVIHATARAQGQVHMSQCPKVAHSTPHHKNSIPIVCSNSVQNCTLCSASGMLLQYSWREGTADELARVRIPGSTGKESFGCKCVGRWEKRHEEKIERRVGGIEYILTWLLGTLRFTLDADGKVRPTMESDWNVR